MADALVLRRALIFGATGLIGGHCLRLLLNSGVYEQVIAVTRRKIPLAHSRLRQIIANFDDLDVTLEGVQADDVFCCLGTTMKKAGSEANFRRVDYDLPLKIATVMKLKGASHFLVVTAMGADRRSLFFYNRIKGELERALSQIVFPYLSIFRPSLLVGERDELRPLESASNRLLSWVSPYMKGPFAGLKPIEATRVAESMLLQAKAVANGSRDTGVLVIQSAEMQHSH